MRETNYNKKKYQDGTEYIESFEDGIKKFIFEDKSIVLDMTLHSETKEISLSISFLERDCSVSFKNEQLHQFIDDIKKKGQFFMFYSVDKKDYNLMIGSLRLKGTKQELVILMKALKIFVSFYNRLD